MRISLSILSFLALAGLASCAPEAQPETPPAPTAAPAAPGTGAPAAQTAAPAHTAAPATPPAAGGAVAFSTLTTMDQKVEHMKKYVTPQLAKVFQEHDGKRYAEFGCGTCHGPKKQDPHVALPPLKLSGDGFQKLAAAKPAVMKFMSEKVTPAMVAAMGAKPYDPATHQGFGCGGCHKVE